MDGGESCVHLESCADFSEHDHVSDQGVRPPWRLFVWFIIGFRFVSGGGQKELGEEPLWCFFDRWMICRLDFDGKVYSFVLAAKIKGMLGFVSNIPHGLWLILINKI